MDALFLGGCCVAVVLFRYGAIVAASHIKGKRRRNLRLGEYAYNIRCWHYFVCL